MPSEAELKERRLAALRALKSHRPTKEVYQLSEVDAFTRAHDLMFPEAARLRREASRNALKQIQPGGRTK